jgi:hypothetical protein
MLECHIFTFNTGWDRNAQKPGSFTDAHELQQQLNPPVHLGVAVSSSASLSIP